MKDRFRAHVRTTLVLVTVGLLSACDGCPPPDTAGTCNGGGGRNANLCLGFPVGTPTVDGNIKDDAGWTNGFHYTLGDGNGTTVAHAIVHGVRSANVMFLGFEVHNDEQFNVNDVIVLAFDPDGTAEDRRRIHIYPLFAAGAGANGVPQKVDYWKGSGTWNSPPVSPTPLWLANNIKVTSQTVSGHNHYYVEVGIPIDKTDTAGDHSINLPDGTDDFGMYFTVVDAATYGAMTSPVSEHSWPLEEHVGAFIEETPAADHWGNGTLGRLANGVSADKLYTNQTPDTDIDLNAQNFFYADVTNKMVDKNGAHATAHGVTATFRIANYGIPSFTSWGAIPSSPNPVGPKDIAGNSTIFQSEWTLSQPQRDQYKNNRAQCTRVELASTGPDTLIVNKRAWANMHFVGTASPFNETARIGVRGYKLPEGQREHEFLLTEYRYNTPSADDWQSEIAGVQPFTAGGNVRHHLLRIPATQEEGVDIAARINPPPIKIPREIVKLPADARGEQRIRVAPGNIVTVFASGSVILRKGQEGPGGRSIGPNGQQLSKEDAASRGKFLLNDADDPATRVGAVVAATDGFRERSFAIGRGATFQVPPGVTELSFGINDTAEGTKLHAGEGFTLEVVQTPPDEIYRYTTTMINRRTEEVVTRLPLGQNLPTWIVCGKRKTGQTLTIKGTVFDRYENVGCFGSIVKSIGGQ